MIERLEYPTDKELNELTDLWEASVRATHDFLSPDDIDALRELVRREALPHTPLYVIRRDNGHFAAFAGIEADKIEMLFVDPGLRGKGIGRRMVEYAVKHLAVQNVDVNEQNTQAAGFYAHLGFRVTGRDATDPQGRPYPILHWQR